MRIETMLISLFLLAFGTVGCSQPEPVTAQYEPDDCNCVEQTTTETETKAENPPAQSDGIAEGEIEPPTDGFAEVAGLGFAGPAEQAADDSPMLVATGPFASDSIAEDTEAPPTEADKESDGPTGVVNLNSASVDELTTLPGVGPALAGRIVEYRQKRRFEKPEHLKRVKGIGEATYAKLAPMITVRGATTLTN